ncbi:glycosyltransferase family 4 protein [Pedobacter sp. L105]|uniref:glycosyltransferase family 4 protein n=1 Tax=Pedobacter sp. L105 TaxID=1641871 RepID=UPI00131D1483|nr:glycosyltransferase family 4 protein [Pedobacter sp. L105]
MKVLIVITRGDSIGGAQTHVLSLAKLFKKDGHDVLICYGGKIEGPFHNLILEEGLKFVTISNLKRQISIIDDISSIFHLRSIIRQFNPDIISLHSSKAGIIGRLSSVLLNIPVVFTVHGWAFTEGVSRSSSILYKFLERKLSVFADKIIVVSNFDKQIAVKYNITSSKKIEVVHNGIDILDNTDIQSRPLNDTINFIMVARFDKQKDHETLVMACKDLDNINVHFVGDGPNLKYIQELTIRLNVKEKFVFHGYKSGIQQMLQNSDVFLLISNWEGFPISTLEAMNCSLPVVVSDAGGAKEAVIEGFTGYVVARKDILSLKNCLMKLIDDKYLRISMGERGRINLIENFSSTKMYDSTFRVFSMAINKK